MKKSLLSPFPSLPRRSHTKAGVHPAVPFQSSTAESARSRFRIGIPQPSPRGPDSVSGFDGFPANDFGAGRHLTRSHKVLSTAHVHKYGLLRLFRPSRPASLFLSFHASRITHHLPMNRSRRSQALTGKPMISPRPGLRLPGNAGMDLPRLLRPAPASAAPPFRLRVTFHVSRFIPQIKIQNSKFKNSLCSSLK